MLQRFGNRSEKYFELKIITWKLKSIILSNYSLVSGLILLKNARIRIDWEPLLALGSQSMKPPNLNNSKNTPTYSFELLIFEFWSTSVLLLQLHSFQCRNYIYNKLYRFFNTLPEFNIPLNLTPLKALKLLKYSYITPELASFKFWF